MAKTMKIKMLTARSDGNETSIPNEVITVSYDEGMRYIKTGQAEPAEITTRETATKKTINKRG